MSIHTFAHSPGVFVATEVSLLRALMDDMRDEKWFPRSPATQERFASFLLKTYDRGVVCPRKLRAFCATAAKLYFQEPDVVAERKRYG
jgi:hypothetical protein